MTTNPVEKQRINAQESDRFLSGANDSIAESHAPESARTREGAATPDGESGRQASQDRPGGLEAEIADRFGLLPNFFRLEPETMASMWGSARFGYLDNPLPSLFKERLFVYLSRFCEVRYCLARHVGFLVGLGRPAGDRECRPQTVELVLRLLRRPLPRGDELEPHRALLDECETPLSCLPETDTPAETAIFACAAHVFLQTPEARQCLETLRRSLDGTLFRHLTLLLTFVRTAHYWTTLHPEIEFEEDVKGLLAAHEVLAECILNDPEAPTCKTTSRLLDELATLRQERALREQLERSNQALRASEARFRHLVSVLPAAVYTTDREGRITLFNERAADLWGRRPEIGKDTWCGSWRIFHPDGTPMPLDECPMAVSLREGRRVGGQEILIERPDATRVCVLPHPEPLYDASGNTIGGFNMLVDITDRKRAEEQIAGLNADLRRRLEELQTLMEVLPVGVFIAQDATCREITMNAAGAAMLRIPQGVNASKTGPGAEQLPFRVLKDGVEVAGEDLPMQRAARLGEAVREVEMDLAFEDGSVTTLYEYALPLFDEAGGVRGCLGAFVDITERKRNERLLVEQSKLLELIVSGQPLDECLSSLCAAVPRLSARARACILLADDERRAFSCSIAPDMPPSFGQGLEGAPIPDLWSALRGETAYRGRSIPGTDIADDGRWLQRWQELRLAHGILACHSAPVLGVDGLPLGSFMLCFREARPPSEWEKRLAEFGARVASIALERARAQQALRSRLRETESLYNLIQAMTGVTRVEEVYEVALDTLTHSLGTDRAAILLFDEDGVMRFKAWRHLSDGYRNAVEGHSPWSPGERDPRPITVEDVAADPSLALFRNTILGEGIRALAFLPLRVDGRLVGKFMVYFDRPRALTPDETHLALSIGSQAALTAQRKEAEEALRESEGQLRAFFESAAVGVAVLTPQTRFVQVNDAFCSLTGYSREEILSLDRDCASLTHPEDVAPTYASIDELVAGHTSSSLLTKRYIRKDGAVIWVQNSVSLIRDAAGLPLHLVALCQDITERKHAEEALKEADRQKDNFLAMLAHELRNPLAPILNAVQIQAILDPADPRHEKQREVIKRQVEQMRHLLDDLLDMSRITRDKIVLRPERLELATVLGEAVDTSRPLIEEKKHRLSVTLPPEVIWLEADRTRIAQVFTNLLNNAAKYTDPGGRISVSAELEGAQVVVRVRDTGIGMAPEVLAHVFDLFSQADRSLDRSQGGLGIGLTIVRRLVEMHGGQVRARSAGPGKGSEFLVRLPIHTVEREGNLRGRDRALRRATPSAARRILVVDDNADMAESLAELLELEGHEVFRANDGPGAIGAALAHQPEVILLDIGLPGRSGYEVAQELRSIPGLKQSVFVAVTGYGQEQDRHRSREAGFRHHLVKPVDYPALQVLLGTLNEKSADGG